MRWRISKRRRKEYVAGRNFDRHSMREQARQGKARSLHRQPQPTNGSCQRNTTHATQRNARPRLGACPASIISFRMKGFDDAERSRICTRMTRQEWAAVDCGYGLCYRRYDGVVVRAEKDESVGDEMQSSGPRSLAYNGIPTYSHGRRDMGSRRCLLLSGFSRRLFPWCVCAYVKDDMKYTGCQVRNGGIIFCLGTT